MTPFAPRRAAETAPGLAEAAQAALARGPVALVSVLATEGSAPRGAGARMLVTAHDLFGTIGGGRLEWRAIEQARRILALPPGAWRMQQYPLGPLLGQCCGGRVRLLIERLADAEWLAAMERGAMVWAERTEPVITRIFAREDGPGGVGLEGCYVEPHIVDRRPILLFGAGHVGRAIARALAPLPFQLAWHDSRPECDARGVMIAPEEALVACAAQAPHEAAVLILTHDHALDYVLTAAALGGAAGFVGLIGSATKRARFVRRLRAAAIDPARLVCPIGLPGLAGKEPEVIAVAVAAQLLRLRSAAGASA